MVSGMVKVFSSTLMGHGTGESVVTAYNHIFLSAATPLSLIS